MADKAVIVKSVEQAIEDVRRDLQLDQRISVFEVHTTARDGRVTLFGHTTEDSAIGELVRRVESIASVRAVNDEVVRLPRGLPEKERHAVIRSAVAPLYQEPKIPSTQITQLVLGGRVDVLSREGTWWRVRGEDGYIGWLHSGYLQIGSEQWAQAWERGETGDPVVSLGAELQDQDGRVFARLPWGARLIRFSLENYSLPDGRRGRLASGELVAVDRLFDRFPPRGESVIRTAQRWLGAPYLWGGVALGGVDCSGLAQAVFWMHGIALPRDSDLQARVGLLIDPGENFEALEPGDLLFFSENAERITHVAISLGNGGIVHSSLTNGGVEVNDLRGDRDFEVKLRAIFTHARRVLPD
jgi:SH3-like domain-containing protein